jgi:hypothetical protein
VISIVAPNSSENSFSYIKGDELYYSTVSKPIGSQATANLTDDASSVSDVNEQIRLSKDGKTLFFVEGYDGFGYDLYYKKTSALKKESNMIASDIISYEMNDKGNLVTYIKHGGDLYHHNLNEKSAKIDENVMSFVASDDGKRVLYAKMCEGAETFSVDIYLSKSGKSGEKIATGISSVKYITKDLETVYYTVGSTFYKLKTGKEPKVISEDVISVVKVYDSGELYFLKRVDDGSNTLYYDSGNNKPVALIEKYYSLNASADNKPVIVFSAENSDTKKKLSYYVAAEKTVSKIDYHLSSVDIDNDGKEVYFITNIDSKTGCGDLYKANISNKIKTPKRVAGDVYDGYYISEGQYIYIKNYNDATSAGEVYLNNKLVGNNIYCDSLNYSKENKTLVYFTDNTKENNASLFIYKSGKSKKISDNVYMSSLIFTPEGELAYLKDYSIGKGTLCICKNKKEKVVTEDVNYVIGFDIANDYDGKMMISF